MKKLIFSVIAMLLLAINANAASVGTINKVQVDAIGTMIVIKRTSDGSLGSAYIKLTGDSLKTFTAIALTAKTTGDEVYLGYSNGGWTSIQVRTAP